LAIEFLAGSYDFRDRRAVIVVQTFDLVDRFFHATFNAMTISWVLTKQQPDMLNREQTQFLVTSFGIRILIGKEFKG